MNINEIKVSFSLRCLNTHMHIHTQNPADLSVKQCDSWNSLFFFICNSVQEYSIVQNKEYIQLCKKK